MNRKWRMKLTKSQKFYKCLKTLLDFNANSLLEFNPISLFRDSSFKDKKLKERILGGYNLQMDVFENLQMTLNGVSPDLSKEKIDISTLTSAQALLDILSEQCNICNPFEDPKPSLKSKSKKKKSKKRKDSRSTVVNLLIRQPSESSSDTFKEYRNGLKDNQFDIKILSEPHSEELLIQESNE